MHGSQLFDLEQKLHEKIVLLEGFSLHRYAVPFEPTIPDSKSGVLTTTL
jgi:hypothetical protein